MENLTPMLAQYQQIKSKHQNCILFFRLGDFYEMFSEDAIVASKILNVVLTSREAGKSGRIPMCGIPFHAANNYITKLIKANHRVAICEQVEDPAKALGLVRREVIRVITPGTFIDETIADSNYILSLSIQKEQIGVAFTDITSGIIFVNEYNSQEQLTKFISKLSICECIYPAELETKIKEIFAQSSLKHKTITLSPYDDWTFNLEIAQKAICSHFHMHNLKGFGIDNLNLAISSCGGLLEYLKQMNKKPLKHIDKISLYNDSEYVFISPAATFGLELEQLFKTIDNTSSALGKRKLKYWLYHPLKDINLINQRQDAIGSLKNNPQIQIALNNILRTIPDIEKSLSRISSGYSAIRDILALRNSLLKIPEIKNLIMPIKDNPLFTLDDLTVLREFLTRTIDPDVPLSNPEGKTIASGYNAQLDNLRAILNNHHAWLKNLQAKEIERTKINSLKIGFTNVFGYYIEISKANLHLVPNNYIRKQTLVNAERFITPELKDFEEKILTAQDKVLKIETEIIKNIQEEILDNSMLLHTMTNQLAVIDSLYSLSILANNPDYTLPKITSDLIIEIKAGKHPMVALNPNISFVANDTLLDDKNNNLLIITGPNMAGKSTYIRQVALLVILAQMGSFIPVESASIGIVDKIFTRIGAHDDIGRGISTFMVEMSETADILNNLSDRSLVILDEIGRGTSTFDGLSLAWAISEYIQSKKARTLFATHFHELTALENEFPTVKNYNIAVKKWQDDIIFLHKIIPGGTDDSYGIYVAKLAGIPKEVLGRSQEILLQLENQNDLKEKICDKATVKNYKPTYEDENIKTLKENLQSLDINALTPLEALNKLQEFKNILKEIPYG